YADLSRQRVIKKFLVGAPPERIIDHSGPRQSGVFEPRAIKRDVLRDPIDHHIVTTRFALEHFVDPDEFRDDVFAAGFLIHTRDKCRRETVVPSKKNFGFFHNFPSVISGEGRRRDRSRKLSGFQASTLYKADRVGGLSLTPDFSPVITATRGNKAVSTALSRARS